MEEVFTVVSLKSLASGLFRSYRYYSAADITVFPAEGLGGFGIQTDILHELAGKIGYRSKDTASNDVALDFGKPDFDLIEPRRVGRGEVKAHTRVLFEELLHRLSLVRRQVIQDNVDLFGLRVPLHDFRQETYEVGTGVTARGFAMYLTRGHVQRRVKRQRAVSIVFESVLLARPGDKGRT